ncbi:hypothetical protein HPB51_006911 [Rhipicephalus microplus]|uniref:DDE Tnp4 domain-containing protein n=1 Tax=Rhipicephalus microplus TaxID=6941 RepID=A0A9J6DZJ5_RHIMP|nr:hypothetical protein HPB51_006911 [Rhipicephalus microplus]
MLWIASLMLLYGAAIGDDKTNLFKGCVRSRDRRLIPGTCTLAPGRSLPGNPILLRYAHKLLKRRHHQPRKGNLITVLRVVRAALMFTEPPRGNVVRVEFVTVQSDCDQSVRYSPKVCKPVGRKAKFLVQYGLGVLQRGWCHTVVGRSLPGNPILLRYAHKLLKRRHHQPRKGNLITVLRVVRAALMFTEPPRGNVVRVEFVTVQSDCDQSVRYSPKVCKPVSRKANGLCQAKFLVQYGLSVLQRGWCHTVVVIDSHKLVDMMRGCVAKHGKQPTPGQCVLVPKRELRNNELYMVLAEAVLQTHYNQFPASRLNTIFNITRVGRQHLEDISKGVLVRLEFHTVPSDCMGPSFYMASECHPISTKVNGICQARFFMRHDFTVLQEFWCGRLRYYLFRLVNVGAPGRFSDGGIPQDSPIGDRLYDGKLSLPRAAMLARSGRVCPHLFVGDEAFQLRPDFMRPLPRSWSVPAEVIYNYRLSRARSVPCTKELCPVL